MSPPIESKEKPAKPDVVEDEAESPENDHVQDEALKALDETVTKPKIEPASITAPNGDVILAEMTVGDSAAEAIKTTPTVLTREGGYTITADKDAQGVVRRIAEADGTVWTRSADGKQMVLNTTGEKVAVKDVQFKPDGTYTFTLEDGRHITRNADRSVSTFNAKNQEVNRTNNDGSQLLFNDKHQVLASIDASGVRRGYAYENGKLASIVEPDGSVWRSADGKEWQKVGSKQTRSGEVEVSANGDQTIKNARGESTTFKIDGATVSKDKEGRVISVADRDGGKRAFEYGPNGKLSAIQDGDTILRTKDGKTWTKDGSKSVFQAEISVDNDGTLREKFAGGKEIAKHTNGWTEFSEKGASIFQRTDKDGVTVTKNKAEQVIEIKNEKGDSRKFSYNDAGTITEMSDAKGTWTSKDGKNWTNEKTKETWSGRREVSEQGVYREVNDKGERKVYKPDGSSISTDAAGHIVKVENSFGKSRSFTYDDKGAISGMTDEKGLKWSTADGAKWKQEGTTNVREFKATIRPDGTYEETDKATGNKLLGMTDGRKMNFDKTGKIQSVDSGDGSVTKYAYDNTGRPSGFEVKHPNGSQVNYDAEGRVVKTKDVNNLVREFKYSGGKLSEINDGGKVWKTTDGNNWTGDNGEKRNNAVWVSPDGKYNYAENNAVVTKQLDGKTLTREQSGASRLQDKAGEIVETVDAKGVKRTFERNPQNVLTKLTDESGTWTSSDGQNWRNQKGEPWAGKVSVDKDGTYFQEDSAGNRQWRKPDGSRQEVNAQAMKVAADEIEEACNGGLTGAGTDSDKIFAVLENKTAAERKMITEIWNRDHGPKYKWTLDQEFVDEMEGSTLEKAKALLHRPDGADTAGTIRVALTESDETFGRSSSELQKVVRNSLETMSSAEIAQTDAEYRKRYGQSLSDAIMKDPNMSQATKDAAAIYLKGHDKRTLEDSKFLASDAVKRSDGAMFQEAMRRAPKELRDHYASSAGQEEMKNAFEGHWYHSLTFGLSGNVTDTELTHVKDYAEYGKLSLATQTSDNSSWLGDNEDAIKTALENLTQEERDRYALGKQLSNKESVDSKITDEEKSKALAYYEKTHSALKSAAGAFTTASQTNELAKWEDMITNRGGGLISRLADHRGAIYDSSTHAVISEVENMSQNDWKRLREDPKQRDQISEVLKTYLSDDEYKRTMAIVDAKKTASTYEESQQSRRSITDAIHDNKGTFDNDEGEMYKAIEHMTDRERALYKEGSVPGSTNSEAVAFANSLNSKIKECLDSDEQKVANGLLDKVKRGEKPEMSIMEKLNLQATYINGDEAQVIRDLQAAFEKDPTLRARVSNPQTAEDKKFASEFNDAARRAMGSSDYEKYAKPLIETGKISIDLQMALNNGTFTTDAQGSYKDIQRASADEKQRILTDKVFRDSVLSGLNEEQKQITLASMQQGEMRPEDKLRSYQIGFGTSETEIKQTFAELNDRSKLQSEGKSEAEIDSIIAERLQTVRNEYARKYGTELSADLVSELGGKDKREVMRLATSRDARGEFLNALNEAATTRSGFGSSFVDSAWDGTGYQLDNEINQLSRTMVEDPSKVREHVANVYKMVDLHSSSKEALADAVVDTTVAAVAVGGAFFTGGVSLSLLAYTGAGAAVFKVGAKAAIMGGDYDASSQALLDASTGFADGFTTFLGAGVAKSAAQKVITQGGKTLLKEGTETTLKEGAEALVKEGLKQGGKISDDAILALAKQVSKDGNEQALATMLKKSIAESVDEQSRHWLKKMVMDTPTNALAGMAGGGASGTIRASAEARDFKEFMQMASTSTAFGTFGGTVGAFVMVPTVMAAGKSWNSVRNALSKESTVLDNLAVAASRPADPDVHLRTDVPSDQVSNFARASNIEAPPLDFAPPKRMYAADDMSPAISEKPLTAEQIQRAETPENIKASDAIADGLSNSKNNWRNQPEVNAFLDADLKMRKAMEARMGEMPPARTEDEMLANFLAVRKELEVPGGTSPHQVAYQELMRAKALMADKSIVAHDIIEARTKELEGIVNKALTDNGGLPVTIEINAEKAGKDGAAYARGSRKVYIHPDELLSGGDAQGLINRLTHEVVGHGSQDQLIVRRLVDEFAPVKAGEKLSPEQLAKVKDVYRQRFSTEPPDDMIAETVARRNGEVLDPSQRTRANEVMKGWESQANTGKQLASLERDFTHVSDSLEKLGRDAGSARRMVEDLRTNDSARSALFGKPGVDDLPPSVKAIINNPNVSDAEARSVLQKALDERLGPSDGSLAGSINNQRKEVLENYFRAPDEREARHIGDATAERQKVRESSEKPVEVADKPPVVLRDAVQDVSDAPLSKFEPSRIAEFSKEIEAKFTDRPISMEQFKHVFDGMSDADRKLALEFLEQSAPNMHSKRVDAQMQSLAKQFDTNSVKADPIKIFVLSGDTSGNALASAFKKNAGHLRMEVVELDAAAIKAMKDAGGFPKNGLIFDDLASATPEQRAVLKEVKNLVVADLGGFNKGLNLYDFGAAKYAGPDLVRHKLADLVAEARLLPGAEGMTDSQLVSRVLSGDVSELATSINPQAKVLNKTLDTPGLANGKQNRLKTVEGQPEAIAQRHQMESLYDEFTSPVVTQKQIQEFLGAMSGNRQAIAAHVLRDGVHYQSFSTMMGQMRDLHEMMLKELPAGKTVKDLLIITGAEPNSSAFMINHLYGKVNGLTKDNYISLAELARRGPGAADGKTVVYIDDYAYSGRQVAGIVNENADVLRNSGGKVVVGTLGKYQTDFNPMISSADSRYTGYQSLNPTALSPNEYKSFYQYIQQPNNPLGENFSLEDIYKVVGAKTALKGSNVTANLLMPYGGPNNNLRFLAEFAKKMGLGPK